MSDEPNWDAIDAEWEEHEREEARSRKRRHGLGTAAGRIGLALSEIYEGKPSRARSRRRSSTTSPAKATTTRTPARSSSTSAERVGTPRGVAPPQRRAPARRCPLPAHLRVVARRERAAARLRGAGRGRHGVHGRGAARARRPAGRRDPRVRRGSRRRRLDRLLARAPVRAGGRAPLPLDTAQHRAEDRAVRALLRAPRWARGGRRPLRRCAAGGHPARRRHLEDALRPLPALGRFRGDRVGERDRLDRLVHRPARGALRRPLQPRDHRARWSSAPSM